MPILTRADVALDPGPVIDLKVTAGRVSPKALTDARNLEFRDDGTPERRRGFYSYHERLDKSGSILDGEDVSTYEIRGLYHFRQSYNTGLTNGHLYLAKVGQYLLASEHGRDWNIPVANNLGAGANAFFSDVYVDADLARYLIVGSTDTSFPLSYWDGKNLPWGGTGERAKWEYLTQMPKEWPTSLYLAREVNTRLFAAGGGTGIHYSAAGDFRTYEGFFALEPAFGNVTGFFPTYYGSVIVGQERAIVEVTMASGVPAASVPITTEVGLINQNSVVRLGNDLWFIDTKGQLTTLATTDRYGSFETQKRSFPVRRRLDKIPHAAWPSAFLVDDPDRRMLFMAVSCGSGTRNDCLLGYDYVQDRWIPDIENKAIGPVSCAATYRDARFGKERAFFGNYQTAPADTSEGTAARVWTFSDHHREDIFLTDRSFQDDADILVEDHVVHVPSRNGPPSVDAGDFSTTGTYFPAGPRTTIRIRFEASGTIPGTTIPLHVEDVATGDYGPNATSINSGYTPGTPIPLFVSGIPYVAGISVGFPAMTVTKGQEVWIIVDQAGNEVVETFSSDLPDLADGIRFAGKKDLVPAGNFVPFGVTAGLTWGDPLQTMRIAGLTIETRVTGARADTEAADDDNHTDQNQYRFFVDVYIRTELDDEWRWVGLLDGNAASRRHIGASLSETLRHGSRQHTIRAAEADAQPMGYDDDVNVQFLEVNDYAKVLWVRFGQETMASLDHGSDAANRAAGIRNGDFNVTGIRVHAEPAARESRSMNEKSLMVRPGLPA